MSHAPRSLRLALPLFMVLILALVALTLLEQAGSSRAGDLSDRVTRTVPAPVFELPAIRLVAKPSCTGPDCR